MNRVGIGLCVFGKIMVEPYIAIVCTTIKMDEYAIPFVTYSL